MSDDELFAAFALFVSIAFLFWLSAPCGKCEQVSEEILHARADDDQSRAESVFFRNVFQLLVIGVVVIAVLFTAIMEVTQ